MGDERRDEAAGDGGERPRPAREEDATEPDARSESASGGDAASGGAAHEDAADEDGEAPERLWDVFRARAISWTTMDRRLRLITGLAIAQLLVAVVLIALRGLPRIGLPGVAPNCLKVGWPACVSVAVQAHQLVQMPTALFVVSVLFLALAWSYLLLGALETQPWVTVLALVLFTLVMHQLPAAGAAAWTLPVLVVAVWVVALLFRWVAAPALVAAAARGRHADGGRPDGGRPSGDSEAADVTAAPSMTDPLALPTWARGWPVAARAAEWVARARRWDLPLVAFGVLLGLILVIYAVTWLATAAIHAQALFTLGVSLQLVILSTFLIPVLFLAGTDFADWGELISGRVAFLTLQVRAPWTLAAATGALALLSLASVVVGVVRPGGWRLPWEDNTALGQSGGPETWPRLGASVALAVLAGGVIALAVWRWRVGTSWPRTPARPVPYRLPYAALSVGAVALTGAVLATVVVAAFTAPSPHESATAPTTVYRHTSKNPRFTIAYPTLWEVVPAIDNGPDGFTTIIFNGVQGSAPAQFAVVAIPAADFQGNTANNVGGVLTAWFQDELHRDVALGDWTGHAPLAFYFVQGGHTVDGVAWERSAHGQVWLLYGYAAPPVFGTFAPVFGQMAGSWTPDPPAVAPATETAPSWLADIGVPGLVLGLLPLLIALCVGLPLLRRWGQGRGGPLAAAGLFALVGGVLLFEQYLPELAAVARIPAERVPSLDLAGVRVVAALATLAMLGWLLVRRAPWANAAEPLALLFALNGGLLVVAIMAALYQGALSVRFSVAQAVIVLLALLWDTTMSGEQITNVEGTRFPRPARVLLFLGYIMLVAAAVLYFSSWQVGATGTQGVEPVFESEFWPRAGLLGLGMPLLLVGFTLELTRWLVGTAGAISVRRASIYMISRQRARVPSMAKAKRSAAMKAGTSSGGKSG